MTVALTLTPVAPLLLRPDVTEDEKALITAGLAKIGRLRGRNEALRRLYDGKAMVQHIGAAIDPKFDVIKTVVGWPGTAVDVKAERCAIDYVEVPGSADLTEQLRTVWIDNDMDSDHQLAAVNKRIHGISFVLVGRREVGGTDKTIMRPVSATQMTCEYDAETRTVTSAVQLLPRRTRQPRRVALYLPDRTVTAEVGGTGYKRVDEVRQSGVVPVVPIVHRPSLDDVDRWGRSDITPAVVSATESAVRTLLSMEVAREFFIMPLRYALDVDPDAFKDDQGNYLPAWQTYWGGFISLFGYSDEPDDDTLIDDTGAKPRQPSLGQLQGQSPSGLVELMKMYSQNMSTEIGIPASYFGFVTDNPPSGDGARMFENRLVLNCRADNRRTGGAFARAAKLALMAEGVDSAAIPMPRVVYHDPATFQPGAVTDALTKQVASGIVPAQSDVALERAGYSRDEVLRIKADRRAEQTTAMVANLRAIADRVGTPQVG